jgi:hypothetical protein
MDEGRNVCLLFPAAIHYGETHEEREKWVKAFDVQYVLGVCLRVASTLTMLAGVIFSIVGGQLKSQTGSRNGLSWMTVVSF